MEELEVKGHGSEWLIKVFEKMGDNPDSKDYIKPVDADVWGFMGDIKIWVDNLRRKGIPK